MEYKLKILSPVHIGCGEQLNGLNFIFDNKKIYVIEPESLIDLLGPVEGQQFARWLDDNSNEIARLEQEYRNKKRVDPKSGEAKKLNNELRQRRQKFTLQNFVEEKKFVSIKQLKEKAVYFIHFQDGVYNDSEIIPFIKQLWSPYIPGTEIKGAIRTAALYCTFKDDLNIRSWLKDGFEKMLDETAGEKKGRKIATYRDFIEAVKNQKKPDTRKKNKLVERVGEIESQLQAKILNGKNGNPDAKYDVMKFMQVGDSNLLDSASSLMVSFAEPFNMSKKFRTYHEYLRPNTLVPLTSFKLEDDRSRTKKLNQMEFTDRHKNLMSGLDSILSCCHQSAKDLLEEEIEFFTKHNRLNIVAQLREIQKLNTVESPVLRIGKDEGYTSLTVGLAVKKLMPELYENVLIHSTKNVSYDSSVTKDNFYFPKSRKIVYWDGQEVTAGWVKLIPPSDPSFHDHTSRENAGTTKTKPDTTVDLSELINKFKKGTAG